MTPEQAMRTLDAAYTRLFDRKNLIERRFKYLDGNHPLAYTTDEWKKFHGDRYKGFSDNWCEVVAQATVDRLGIAGFSIDDSLNIAKSARNALWSDWNRNEMGAQSQQGFLSSVVAARSAVIVWDDGTNSGTPLVTWERPDQVSVQYDSTGRRRLYGIKTWVEDETEYATLYTPDAIWKYERPTAMTQQLVQRLVDQGWQLPIIHTSVGGFEPRDIPGEPWPVKNPLGVVPVVEVMNRPRIGMEPLSDIDGVIAMQDAINLMWSYLFASADYASMPSRVILGALPKVPVLDENGQVIGTKPARMEDLQKGRLLALPDATNIAQWEAAKADYFLSVMTEGVKHIAAQTRTPGHYLLTNDSMANLNGDALTAAEVPLVSKCGTFQTHASPDIKEIGALMAQVRGNDRLAGAIRESESTRFVQWNDAAMHSLAQVADAATKDRSVGFSLYSIWKRRYGMTDAEIDAEYSRIKAERAMGLGSTPVDVTSLAPAGALQNPDAAQGGV